MENSPLPSNGQLEGSSAPFEDNTLLMSELRNEVFTNELIRDQIFDYVFSSNKNIGTCRLIDRSWLDYVTCRLQKNASARPKIYELLFTYGGMSKEFQAKKSKKYRVQQFLETWASFPGAGSRVPLFSVEFIRPSNVTIKTDEVQDLITCLVRCGNGFNSLKLNLESSVHNGLKHAVNCVDFFGDLAQLDLPNLNSLEVVLHKQDNLLVTLLLPPILLGCKQLMCLHLEVENANQVPVGRLVSGDGKTEYLPNTLETIALDVLMTSELLSNLLLKNSLPNLIVLDLNISKRTDQTNVVSRILHQFARQLKYFRVDEISKEILFFENRISEEPGNESTLIKFPVMEKLKEMSLRAFHSELETGEEQRFPVLKKLKLEDQSGTKMRKWTHHFQFNSVEDLDVEDDDFTLELSQQLHISFPHLQKLRLMVWGKIEDGSLSNIFQHLFQLRTLRIELEDTEEIIGASTWDAILLGVTPEYAKYLAECPRGLWDSINLNNLRSPKLSIVNLSNLNTFSLELIGYDETTDILLSDVSFHFAFLRMPNLHKLTLDRGFGASKKMVEEWTGRGREFNGHERDEREDTDSNVSDEEFKVHQPYSLNGFSTTELHYTTELIN